MQQKCVIAPMKFLNYDIKIVPSTFGDRLIIVKGAI